MKVTESLDGENRIDVNVPVRLSLDELTCLWLCRHHCDIAPWRHENEGADEVDGRVRNIIENLIRASTRRAILRAIKAQIRTEGVFDAPYHVDEYGLNEYVEFTMNLLKKHFPGL